MSQHQAEVQSGKRFEFGKNWENFLKRLDGQRIANAEQSLCEMLGVIDLKEKTFLDVGSGSGLFSLAARRLGASVHSFDYDPQSVACTNYLKEKFFRNDSHWAVEQGSVLDESYVQALGKFDIVYSWGVLHHTGAMWKAIENSSRVVRLNGLFYIALYNDEGPRSRIWHTIKKIYNVIPFRLGKFFFGILVIVPWEFRAFLIKFVQLKPLEYFETWIHYSEHSMRGMNKLNDVIDWVGGFPFEVASPAVVFAFLKERGFQLENLRVTRGLGCNEFVFSRRT